MSRRKHQEGKAIEPGQRISEQIARAKLGRLYEMTYIHRCLSKIIEGQRVIDAGKNAVPKDFIKDQKKTIPGLSKTKAEGIFLWEQGESKILTGLRDIIPHIEVAIRKGDADEFRRIADLIDIIQKQTPTSPVELRCAELKRAAMNTFWKEGEWPWTASKVREWIADQTGIEYPTNKISAAAKRVGLTLRNGRKKKKD
jgi:hypothetical protein